MEIRWGKRSKRRRGAISPGILRPGMPGYDAYRERANLRRKRSRLQGLNENPFAVLTAVAAPALLTNACSLLSLGTAHRIARVVDRTYGVTAARAVLLADDPEFIRYSRRLDQLQTRGKLLVMALFIRPWALSPPRLSPRSWARRWRLTIFRNPFTSRPPSDLPWDPLPFVCWWRDAPTWSGRRAWRYKA